MPFTTVVVPKAQEVIDDLEALDPPKFRKVAKTIGLLAANPRHPSLHTHEYASLSGPSGEKVFEAYVENSTSSAYRVFWFYGPKRAEITIMAVTPHP